MVRSGLCRLLDFSQYISGATIFRVLVLTAFFRQTHHTLLAEQQKLLGKSHYSTYFSHQSNGNCCTSKYYDYPLNTVAGSSLLIFRTANTAPVVEMRSVRKKNPIRRVKE